MHIRNTEQLSTSTIGLNYAIPFPSRPQPMRNAAKPASPLSFTTYIAYLCNVILLYIPYRPGKRASSLWPPIRRKNKRAWHARIK